MLMPRTSNLTLADFVSFSRIPLAFAFIYYFEQKALASLILLTGWLSDIADGYIARKNGKSIYGQHIDAITDKFFIAMVVGFLLYSNAISIAQTGILLMRDISVLLLSLLVYGMSKKHKADYIRLKWESKISGKVTTGLQFIILLAIVSGAADTVTLFYFMFISGAITIADYSLIVMEKVFQ